MLSFPFQNNKKSLDWAGALNKLDLGEGKPTYF